MQGSIGTCATGRRGGFLSTLAAGLLCLAALLPAAAFAQSSTYCPTPLTATVANGGSTAVDVSTCDGPFDGGMSGPIAPFAQHGSVTIGANSGGVQFVTYAHNGDSATSDVIWLEDNDLGTVRINITISAPTSSIVVAPATLPTLTAGTAFSQTLTSSGGSAPYTYTLESGTLPVGLSLAGGVVSGTPTQRGPYAFSVRSTDSATPTADFVVKGYSGTVQNPALSISPTSATAVQGVAFSQTLTASGGVAPHTFALESGSFPAGISISSGGVISGTTSAAIGNYPVVLRVTDASTGPGSYFELENFTLTVSAPPSVSITVAPASVSEDGATNLVYTVTRSFNLSSPTVVNITTTGTATSGTDYTGGVATVTIPAGAGGQTITINPTTDGTIEADETVTLTVAAGAGYTVGTPPAATGTILNDDVPTATIAVSPAAVAEDGATNLVYTVSLSSNPGITSYSINFTTSGTATSGTDYAAVTSPLVIPAGVLTGTITINPTADATIEGNETAIVTLNAGAGYTVGAPASATGTVLNDDLPTLTINDVTLGEGDSGTTSATFTVSLSAPAGPGGVTFDIATANGTATSGVDYVANSLTGQTIPTGSSTYTFTVQLNGDALNEPNETFFVNVTNVTNAVVIDGQGLGTINNDDALPSLAMVSRNIVERNALTQAELLQVTLSAPSGQTVTANWATANGTATAGSDYVSASGTVTFTPGQTTQVISVGVTGDTVPEANETFTVTLTAPVNATIATATGTYTILNDDVPVTVSPTTLPNGAVATAYSQTITASGGVAPYNFTVTAGSLPPDLTLSPGGVISGTPTAGGTFNFTVTATDSSPVPGPFSGSQSYTLVINPPTVVLPATALPNGTLGATYPATNITQATGGTAPYTYSVTAGALPPGLTLEALTGAITGTPSAVGTFNFSITATDSSTGTGPYTATQAYAITVIDVPPVANAVSLTVAYNAAATNVPLNISGGAPTSVAVATAPVNGTAIASGTSITYQPNAGFAGADSFTYTATNSGGTSAPATVSVTVSDAVITITASGGFAATVAAPYTQTFTWNGGAQPWSGYQVSNLPAGLAITGTTANSVTVSGTPTQAGSFALNASATDSSTGNGPYTVGEVFTLTVAAPALAMAPANSTAFTATYNTPFSQTFTASGGVGPYTYSFSSAGPLPAGFTFNSATGVLSGTPTSVINQAFTITATDTGSSGTGAPFTISQNYSLFSGAPTITVTPATVPNATPGVAYSQALTASGGAGPYLFQLRTGTLPAGITLSSAGVISGTPTAVGSFTFSIRAIDANGFDALPFPQYTLVVDAPTLTMTPAAGTLTATYGAAYSQSFTASGSPGPYSYAVTGTLPAGVSFSGNTLSGTPTAPGSYAITVTATDTGLTGAGAPFSIAQNYTLDVPAPTIVVAPATLPNTTAGLAYSQTLSATGGVGPYTFAVTAGALPNGLSLTSAGALSGSTTAAGTFNFTVTATDAFGQSASRAYTVVVAVPTITLTPATLPAGTAGAAYSQTLTVAGGIAPYTVTQSGALPAGLSFNAATRTFSGTPTQSGTFAISVTATDSTGGTPATVTNNYTLTIAAPTLTLTPATVPNGTAGVAYSQTFVASGGVAPYSYALTAGALPAGLSLSAAGALSGTPTVAGTFNFSVRATDSTTGAAGTATNAYTLVISAPTITINPATLPNAIFGVPYNHVVTAIGGTAPYAYAISAGALPNGVSLSSTGTISGAPTAAGTFAFTVRATDALGFTGTRAYTVTAVERPDPSRDVEVLGLLNAQAEAARRFASTQINNFQQRMESTHGAGGRGDRFSNGLTFTTSDKCLDNRRHSPAEACNLQASNDDGAPAAGEGTPALRDPAPGASQFTLWTAGNVRSGNYDGHGGGGGLDFETDGVSVGADYRLTPAFTLGAGLGYGRDDSDIGSNNSRVEGDAYTFAVYGSYHPGEAFFLDGLVGYQKLSLDLRRYLTVNGGTVTGSRDGDQWFASLSTGADIRRDRWQFTPYARLDIAQATLDGYAEHGDPIFALVYGDQDVDTSTGNVGMRFEFHHPASWGVFSPQFRLEYQHDFKADSSATMQYFDLLSGPVYRADLDGFDRNRYMLGVGAMFVMDKNFSIRVEYRGLFGNGGDRDNAVQLNFQKGY